MDWKMAAIIAFAAVWPLAAAAETNNAEALLKRAFDNYRAKSSESMLTMTVHRPDWERQMTLKASTRGQADAIVRFVAPPKDAGNATLKLGNETWVFNPKLNQVIKLPASMLGQAWMGSDFSYNDLAKSEDLLTQYTHKTLGTEKANGHMITAIEADPKPGAPVVWGKVILKLRDDDVVMEETFFDQDMKPARHMQTDKVGALGDRDYPVVMTMHPLDEPGQWTRIETTDAQFNINLPDYLFTLSNLQNPRS